MGLDPLGLGPVGGAGSDYVWIDDALMTGKLARQLSCLLARIRIKSPDNSTLLLRSSDTIERSEELISA
jgi:hypothetical protein